MKADLVDFLNELSVVNPEAQVVFERLDEAGNAHGWIANVLSEGEDGLILTFVLNVDTSAESDIKQTYTRAIASTLRRTRELLATPAT